MEASKLRPAELNKEALQILREAEASINHCIGQERDPAAEIFLIALNSEE
ncbi:MAG TPA: hypothetical protein PKV91_00580 [Bacillota bacterium]|jgi:hypothetical protein|nr:hypothetical protein [Bacillota bacterium]HOA34793.1 hypothetical protein [Bacillota bacterium]HOJ83551.1 hypothetical protein [Bacillota bacterium]HOL15269.1 hypothetical protein [Bacillota bacterium]HPZ10829.1 hypothetical protein [Bacillota bacterium]